MDALISVIVPTYNIEACLGRALDSLLGQTYANMEIIVVDDGSTDGTGALLDAYAAKHKNIVAVHQENGGVSSARNRGLALARGAYIGFLDGDDVAEPDMFELLAGNMVRYGVDISHCGYQMVFPSRRDYYYNTGEKRLMDREAGLSALLSGEKIEPALWNKLYRAELFQTVRLAEDIRVNEDVMANFELFDLARSSYYEDLPKYRYMIRPGSAAVSPNRQKAADPVTVNERIFERTAGRPGLRALAYRRLIYSLVRMAEQTAWPEEAKAARKRLRRELFSAMRHIPVPLKLRGMAIGAAFIPHLYRLVRKVHDAATGSDKKYLVE